MPNEHQVERVDGTDVERKYVPPQLVALGNLRDLLAGGGSKDCDGTIAQLGPQTGTC